MIGYASRTGTKRNLEALWQAGWRLMLSPKGMMNGLDPKWRYALDNGAWWAFQNKQPFDVPAFEQAVARFGPGADFIVVPDIVCGGVESLTRSRRWWENLRLRPELRDVVLMIAVQDGFEPRHVAPMLGPKTGVFVGGSTGFKESTMARWCALARDHGAPSHVVRVNTIRRIALCAAAGADSFDGTSVTMFAKTLPKLDGARRQPDMFVGANL